MSATCVRAILRKELREYQRSRTIVVTMAVVPLVFIIEPLIQIFSLPAASAGTLLHKHPLLYMLGMPVLSTPIRREELILGKALAVLVPALAVLRAPELLAQLLFTPLLATWSIWAAMAISARSSDFRVAQQLSTLASLPSVIVSALVSFDVIHATLGLALGLAAALLLRDRLGWRVVSALFDRERLITGTRS